MMLIQKRFGLFSSTWSKVILSIGLLLIMTKESICISSPLTPFTTYNYFTSLEVNVSDLWWNINETSQEIIFELHVKTTGWMGLGISPGKI